MWGLLLLAPALALLAALFAYPLVLSIVGAFTDKEGNVSAANYQKIFELYTGDIVFSGVVSCFTVAVTDVFAVAIGGYLTLGDNAKAVAALRWLYRWPLFIPFVVAAQMMRGFLAKNGLMNNSLVTLGLIEPANTFGLLDWRGVVITFVWKQLPFVTLLVAGAMASLDRSMIEAARNLGAGRLRVLLEIIVAAGPRLASGRFGSHVRHTDVGALGSDDDQRRTTHHDHRRHGLSDHLARRLWRRQRARRRILPYDRDPRLALP